MEPVASAGIAAPEIIGQQRGRTGAEPDATARSPLLAVQEVGGAPKIGSRGALGQRSPKMGMQAENLIDVQCIRGNEQLVTRLPTACLQPPDVLIARDARVLAVATLAGPICRPVRRVTQ